MIDPLVGHLLDILDRASADSFILGGGLGINVKRSYLINAGIPTLIAELPEARVTTDIDLFLRMEVFIRPEKGQELRTVLDKLDYAVRTDKWQFEKPLGSAIPGKDVVVDLLARLPVEGEKVRVRSNRVGSGSDAGLHGRETAEAFAVEVAPVHVEIRGPNDRAAGVLVPHPYAWLNMKIRAAHDWHRFQLDPGKLRDNQSPPSGKHASDVAVLLAMLTEAERDEARALAKQFSALPTAISIRTEAEILFGTRESPGWIEARRQTGTDLDHGLLWEVLIETLGIRS